jgi:hypothetical protein
VFAASHPINAFFLADDSQQYGCIFPDQALKTCSIPPKTTSEIQSLPRASMASSIFAMVGEKETPFAFEWMKITKPNG